MDRSTAASPRPGAPSAASAEPASRRRRRGAAATPRLSRKRIDALQRELDALRDEVVADLGQRDADYIRRIVRVRQAAEVGGRALLMFGLSPLSWGLGVGALSLAKILDNMEIGHNVMHGQYDWMNDPALHGPTHEWDIVCTGDNWRHYHNYEHHTWTNVLGKDRDVGYGLLRVSEEQPWSPVYLVQPITYGVLMLVFQWGVGIHDQDPWGNIGSAEGRRKLASSMKPFYRKAARQLLKDYVFYPALALGNAPRVAAGNLVSNGIRNLWTNAVIFCGHFPEGVRLYSEAEVAMESRGDWYLRQMQGSANIEGSRLLYILTGHLSHQIEHHLFPDLPAHRYPEIAPRVREICARYGVPYNSGSFARQYGSVLRKLWCCSFPGPRAQSTESLPAH